MSFLRLIIKSIWHFRRQHLALFAGVLLSTAVLTGALITGDSVKYSLRKMVDLRLGKVGFALQAGDRFVSSKLAKALADTLGVKTAALIKNQGIASNPAKQLSMPRVKILALDDDFWELSQVQVPALKAGEAMISSNLAESLALSVGDDFILRPEQSSVIPVNAPFAKGEAASKAMRLKVVAILNPEQMGRFSLQSNQVAPHNVFVSYDFFANEMELDGLANLLLVENNQELNAEKISKALEQSWSLADAGLEITPIAQSDFLELTSRRIFIEPAIAKAVQNLKIENHGILTYLVNQIRANRKSTPYSFISAAPPSIIGRDLKANEIIVNRWLADDLELETGDSLTLEYFVIGAMRRLKEESHSFVVSEIVPLDASPAMRVLMPDFPGMTDAATCTDWDAGVPVDMKKIRDKDEKYWDDYRGTPKAFVSLDAGIAMWSNSFGSYTAFRFSGGDISAPEFEHELLAQLTPRDLGLQFRPVRNDGISAVSHAVDFGELFLSLSFFVILAGLLLTALLFSLHVASRNREGGLLAAVGFSRRRILFFRIFETLPVFVTGALAGAYAGILYNQIIMAGLNTVWQDVVRTTTLWIHIENSSLITGILSGSILAVAISFFISKNKSKQPLHALISKTELPIKSQNSSKYLINTSLIIVGFAGTLTLVLFSLINKAEQNAGLFLPAGGLFLMALLALLYRWFIYKNNQTYKSTFSLWQLAMKNSGYNRIGGITSISLLALGAFTIIITGANQQTFYGASQNRASGTGGYLFWVESSLPLLYDLNSSQGRLEYGMEDEPDLEAVEFMQFHSLAGDDASCLNLNQVDQPRVLGVDEKVFDARSSFDFARLGEGVDEAHPWLALSQPLENGLIPAFADQTVITWGLMKKVGDTLTYLNEQGKEIKLLLAGGLKNSIFQGNILIADRIFRENFPSSGGSNIMLIDAPARKQQEISKLLSTRLTDYGIQLTPTNQRLAAFNSVTNTYLIVFMMLGGLGVLIGTIGLGIVVLRNIMERKSELALLAAIGFSEKKILSLLLIENVFLLMAGLLIGTLAALVGILPSLLSPAFSMNTSFVGFILLLVFFNGLLWIYLPARQRLKHFGIESLQEE